MASQIVLPKLTYEMQEGRILEWLCAEGEVVSKGQPLFVVETDKAAVEVAAEKTGTLLKIVVEAGLTVATNTLVAWIGAEDETVPEIEKAQPDTGSVTWLEEKPSQPPSMGAVGPAGPLAVRASPRAKRLARELDVDLREVQEQAGAKRIREADVRAYADAQAFELLKPTPLQRAMATRLAQSAAIPQFSAVCDVNMTGLDRYNSQLGLDWEESHGFRLTHTHILASLVAQALQSCPRLNASWTEEGIRLYRTVNLGVAMATDRGLVVPVVRSANLLSLDRIASEIARLRQAAECNRLLPQDMDGGTFTLTNVGMMGITLSIPVLNPPQSGILAVGTKRDHLTLEDGQLRSIPVSTVTLVADHRVVDGAISARFLGRLKELVENPWLALSIRGDT